MSADDELEPVEDEEGPDGWRVRLLRQLEGPKWWSRFWRKKPTAPADEGYPLCPSCLLPYHPLMTWCPECGELVNRYAAIMSPSYIWVWGKALRRAVAQPRLSRLVCAFLLLQAFRCLIDAAISPLASLGYEQSQLLLPVMAIGTGLGLVFLGAALRLIESVIRRWGTWREDDEGCAGHGEPSGD